LKSLIATIKGWLVPSEETKKKLRKWVIPAATGAALASGGYEVSHFDENKGYAVVDTLTHLDTTYFIDSVTLDSFAHYGVTKFK